MRAIFPLLSLSTAAQALYFFIDGTQPKCFYEELPKDTLVVGHYNLDEYDENTRTWSKHDGLSVYISVDVGPLSFLHCRPFILSSYNTHNTLLRQSNSLSLHMRPSQKIDREKHRN